MFRCSCDCSSEELDIKKLTLPPRQFLYVSQLPYFPEHRKVRADYDAIPSTAPVLPNWCGTTWFIYDINAAGWDLLGPGTITRVTFRKETAVLSKFADSRRIAFLRTRIACICDLFVSEPVTGIRPMSEDGRIYFPAPSDLSCLLNTSETCTSDDAYGRRNSAYHVSLMHVNTALIHWNWHWQE